MPSALKFLSNMSLLLYLILPNFTSFKGVCLDVSIGEGVGVLTLDALPS